MQGNLTAILAMQPSYNSQSTVYREKRGNLLENLVHTDLAPHFPLVVEGKEFVAEGSNGKGNAARVPWVRVFDPTYSISAAHGWYLTYLFRADGSGFYLTLMHASTRFGKEHRSTEELTGLVSSARELLKTANLPEGLVETIDLRVEKTAASSVKKLLRGYEQATAYAFYYQFESIPTAHKLLNDIKSLLPSLCILQAANPENIFLNIDEEHAKEIEEFESVINGSDSTNNFRSNAKERRAIECRAVDVVSKILRSEGWTVTELGRPYDLHCTTNTETLKVEVKGTTSVAPRSILLTRNEVKLHSSEQNTALFIVSGIKLEVDGEVIRGVGGVPKRFNEWTPNPKNLAPLSYQYTL